MPTQPTKRLPAPATQPAPSPSTTHLKPRSRACPLTRPLRPSHLYRTLSAVALVVTPLVLLALYYGPSIDSGAIGLAGFSLLEDALAHTRRLTRRALRLYQRELHLHPLLSRAVTAGVIFFIADCAAQFLDGRGGKPTPPAFSMPRLARYSFYGLIFMGPFLYIWYAVMNEYGPEDDFRGSLLKCVFEQLTLEPICISMYIVYDGIICHRGWRAVQSSLDSQFFPLLFKNAIFWLPANFANYYIGTPDLRVVFANLCSLFWNIYFSAKVNKIAVPSFPMDKENRYVPLSNLDRDKKGLPASASYSSSDISARRPGDSQSSSRLSTKTLIV